MRKTTRRGSSKRNRGKQSSRYRTTVQAYPLRRMSAGTRRERSPERKTTRSVQSKRRTLPREDGPFDVFEMMHVAAGGWLQERSQPKHRRTKGRLGRMLFFKLRALFLPAKGTWHFSWNTVFNIVFLAMLGWLLSWFFTADQFYVQVIEVSGQQRVSGESIAAASGLAEYSIFWLNPGQVEMQIIQTLPLINDAKIKVGLPNKIHLTIQEQGGQVMWQIADQRYWVDDDGQLHLAQAHTEPKIVVIDIRPGLPDSVDPRALAAAQQLAELLPDIGQVGYAPTTGLRFTLPQGGQVYLGVGEDMAAKLTLLQSLETKLAEQSAQLSLLDLRFPASPYYRLSNGDEGGL